MTLKFLALQGAPYIYDISRLRVKQFKLLAMIMHLELEITDGVNVSIVSRWPWLSAAKKSV
jgi:hypothetical protein